MKEEIEIEEELENENHDLLKKELSHNDEENHRLNIDEKAVTLDEFLTQINEFGVYQKLMMAFLSALLIPIAYQPFLTTFLQTNPSWSCTPGSNECNTTINYVAGKHEEFRCSLNRSSWKFDQPKTFSTITEWDLVCEKKDFPSIASSIFFVGQLFGTVVAGFLFDRYGRRIVMWQSFLLFLVLCAATSFIQDFWWFSVLRLLAGACVPFIPIYICAIEMVGSRWRNFTGVFIWTFFTISMLLIALQAWLLQHSWRILLIVLSAPYLILLPGFKYFPESVRWLLVNGKQDRADEILRKVAKMNKRPFPQAKLEAPSDGQGSKHVTIKQLFVPMRVAICMLLLSLIWVVNAMVYYGISLAVGSLSGNTYRDFALLSIVEIPAYFLLVKTSEKFGRKASTMYPMILTGVCCICITFLQDKTNPVIRWSRVGLGLVGKFNITISFSAAILWAAEILPTVIRSRGYTILTVMSRLGAVSAPWVSGALGKIHPYLPFLTMGVLGVLGGVCCYPLKETKGERSADVMQDLLTTEMTSNA